MPQATALAVGTPCWWELATKDVDTAKKFYTALCAWDVEEQNLTGVPYHVLKKDDQSFGGIMDASGPDWENVPSHWMTYFNCHDVDACAAKVTDLGGKVCVPPTDIPNVGRFAVVNDPTGGTFSLFTSGDSTPMPLPEVIVWNELLTRDQAAAVEFYTGLFDYSTEDMPIGADGVYKFLKTGEKPVGGIFEMKGPEFEQVPVHWLPYIGTDNVDHVAERVKELGGQIIHGPADIPNNIGRFVVIHDPTGGVIAFYQPGQQA